MDDTCAHETRTRTNVSRRRALRALGVGGVGLTGFSKLASADQKVTITITRDNDGPRRQKEVPRQWNEHRKRATRVTRRLSDQYYPKAGVESVSKIRHSKTYAGKPGFQVKIGIDSSIFDGSIPDKVDGIPVKIVEAKERGLGSCEGYTSSIDPVPGGVECHEGNGTYAERGFGTTFTTVQDFGGTKWMMTAAHLFRGNDCDFDPSGEFIGQCDTDFGEVRDHDWEADWATIDPTHKSIESTSKIKTSSDTYDVVGWYTDTGIDELIITEDVTWQNGVTTGESKGTVEANNVSNGFDCVDFEGEGVGCSIYNAEGDSGGPVYTLNNDSTEAELVCIYQMYVNSYLTTVSCDPEGPAGGDGRRQAGYLRGVAFHHINNSYGYQIVT